MNPTWRQSRDVHENFKFFYFFWIGLQCTISKQVYFFWAINFKLFRDQKLISKRKY